MTDNEIKEFFDVLKTAHAHRGTNCYYLSTWAKCLTLVYGRMSDESRVLGEERERLESSMLDSFALFCAGERTRTPGWTFGCAL